MEKKKEQYEQALEKKKKAKHKQKIEEKAKKFTPIRFKYKLLWGIATDYYIPHPKCTAVASASFAIDLPYFHHGCDFVDDVGWGKGYRVLQMMCKYVSIKMDRPEFPVPSIHDIQKILVRIGNKPKFFQRLKEPIGSKEAMLVLEALFNHKVKLIETTGAHLTTYADFFNYHYKGFGMLSTDSDEDCRGICGIFNYFHPRYFCLKLVDPGYNEVPKDINELRKKGYVNWKKDDEYDKEKRISICCVNI